jgi:hypothetical protein
MGAMTRALRVAMSRYSAALVSVRHIHSVRVCRTVHIYTADGREHTRAGSASRDFVRRIQDKKSLLERKLYHDSIISNPSTDSRRQC